MKAIALTGIRQLETIQVDEPKIESPDQVLLHVDTIGVCGSDLHYYRTGRIGDQVVDFPFILGHECSATVLETGSDVETLEPGDRVALDPLIWCNQCDQCLSGRVHTCRNQAFLGCPGQHAGCLGELLVMPAASCFRIPESLTDNQAALVEPFSIGLYAQRLAEKDLTDKAVAILGSGPIGLSVMLACKAAGCRAVYMTDIRDYRVEHARKMNADFAANPQTTDIVAGILDKEPDGVDYSFECAGEQETVDQAVRITRPGGKILLVGIPEFDRISFEVSAVRRAEITLQPVRRQNECVQDAIDLVAAGKVDLDAMVTHEMDLDQTEQAYRILDDYSDGVIKAMVHVPT